MIKLSDYVFDYLAERGVRDVFLVSGGGIMHLCDSVGRHPKIRYIANNHEQACAIAAEAYARVKNSIGVCLVTTGPGSTNALSGIVGAWFDSIPVLVLSGQVRVPLIADYDKLRQLGPQEANVLPMARPATKYAASIRDAAQIRSELDAAFSAALAGRPGPVWLEFPLDIQSAMLDQERLPGLGTPVSIPTYEGSTPDLLASVEETHRLLREARRPVLIIGNGIRLGGSGDLLTELLERTALPALVTITGMDLVPESYAGHLGAFGPYGRRAANFALQNSDLVLSIGASLSIASIGFNTTSFAPKARKVIVNIDPGELSKPSLAADVSIPCDAKDFLSALLARLARDPIHISERWREVCARWKADYPPGPPPDFLQTSFINSYSLVDEISRQMQPGEVMVTGNSLDACSVYQSFRVKQDQRVLINANYGSMGWDLPAAVGACVAAPSERVVLVTGDGSIQFNIQEMQTVAQNNLNLRIFVLNNEGYESIRATQTNYFAGRFVGSDRASGVGNPDFEKLAGAYRISYERLDRPDDLIAGVARVLGRRGPTLCEVRISPTQPRTPKASSFRRDDGTMESRPIEDMFPFLPREEVHRNMHLFDDDDR